MNLKSLHESAFPSEFEFYDLGVVQKPELISSESNPNGFGVRFEFLGQNQSSRLFGILCHEGSHEDWSTELGNTIASRLADQMLCFLSPPFLLQPRDLEKHFEHSIILWQTRFWMQTKRQLIPFDFLLTKEGLVYDQISFGNT